jgi:hypothetical protein
MDPEKKYKIKAFLWDLFIRPIYTLFDLSQINSIVVGFLIFNVLVLKSELLYWILAVLLIIFLIIDLVKYYKSGKYVDNLRKHKYPEYRAAIKKVRAEKKLNIPKKEEVESPREYLEEKEHIAEKCNHGEEEKINN